jgi:predicted transcriptional regulator
MLDGAGSWRSRQKLAKMAGVSAQTVRRLEDGAGLKASTVAAIRYALEKAGVVFIGADDAGREPG